MTSNGSTLVECPPKNEELLLSERYKHPPCVPYKRGIFLKIQVRAKPSKRLLHVDRSCVGLSPHCYHCCELGEKRATKQKFVAQSRPLYFSQQLSCCGTSLSSKVKNAKHRTRTCNETMLRDKLRVFAVAIAI